MSPNLWLLMPLIREYISAEIGFVGITTGVTHMSDNTGGERYSTVTGAKIDPWKRIAALTRALAAATSSWRCYYCDEVFADEDEARNHFGGQHDRGAGCVERLTTSEKELRAEVVQARADRDVR